MKNTDFVSNRTHSSGYGVTFHSAGWMGESSYSSKQAALEVAQSRVLNGSGVSATVFPRRSATMLINHQRVTAIYYWRDAAGLQFRTSHA